MSPYTVHPQLTTVTNNPKIWRFMNFEKFLFLIQKTRLFFASADVIARQFDPWEGIYPPETLDLTLEHFKKSNHENIANNAEKLLGHLKNLKTERVNFFLNCWHINDSETKHMCPTYASRKLGVTIQSDFNRLCESLANVEKNVYIAAVEYDQKIISTGDVFQPYFNKRKQFKFDQELRCLIWDRIVPPEEPRSGISFEIDLKILIENIFVTPGTAQYEIEAINDMIEKYGFSFKVNKSSLDDLPPY